MEKVEEEGRERNHTKTRRHGDIKRKVGEDPHYDTGSGKKNSHKGTKIYGQK